MRFIESPIEPTTMTIRFCGGASQPKKYGNRMVVSMGWLKDHFPAHYATMFAVLLRGDDVLLTDDQVNNLHLHYWSH